MIRLATLKDCNVLYALEQEVFKMTLLPCQKRRLGII
jgi:hypothetical protein